MASATDPEDVRHELFTLADDGPWEAYNEHAKLKVHAARRTGTFLNSDYSVKGVKFFQYLAANACIIHYHLPWPFAQVLDLCVPVRKRRIATYHADICGFPFAEAIYRPAFIYFLKRLDAVICTSEKYRESSKLLQMLSEEQIYTAELGIRLPSFNRGALQVYLRNVAKRFGNRRFMLFLGTTRRYKGVEVAIEALVHTDTRLVIAGSSPNHDALAAKAKGLGVFERLFFLGAVGEEEKWALIRHCSAVVLPSTLRSEAFGLALVEAGAGGRPAITCEIGTATTDIIRDGETGLVVPPSDPLLLGRAMQRLHQDVQFADDLGHAARRRYRNHFTAEAYAERMRVVYQSVSAKEGLENRSGKII